MGACTILWRLHMFPCLLVWTGTDSRRWSVCVLLFIDNDCGMHLHRSECTLQSKACGRCVSRPAVNASVHARQFTWDVPECMDACTDTFHKSSSEYNSRNKNDVYGLFWSTGKRGWDSELSNLHFNWKCIRQIGGSYEGIYDFLFVKTFPPWVTPTSPSDVCIYCFCRRWLSRQENILIVYHGSQSAIIGSKKEALQTHGKQATTHSIVCLQYDLCDLCVYIVGLNFNIWALRNHDEMRSPLK